MENGMGKEVGGMAASENPDVAFRQLLTSVLGYAGPDFGVAMANGGDPVMVCKELTKAAMDMVGA